MGLNKDESREEEDVLADPAKRVFRNVYKGFISGWIVTLNMV